MRLKSTASTFVLVATLVPAMAFADGDPAAGKGKAQTCAACHGADGNSANPVWPSLAGQSAEYLSKQLTDFVKKNRNNDQMSPMSANLSDADIADLAAYFSSQTLKVGAADPAKLETGARIYRAGNAATGLPACMACHGPTGAGNPAAGYPALGGQHADYAVLQLKAFKSEDRANDKDSVMRDIASRMTNADMDAVASYMQGLH